MFDLLTLILAVSPVVWLAWRSDAHELFGMVIILVLLGGSLLFGVYMVVAECWIGQTLGKHLCRIRVVRESGAGIGIGQAVVRQLPLFLQVFVIDALFALFTEKSQRAFELLSKTRVVLASPPEVR